MTFDYYDHRRGDTYTIFLDDDAFSAVRYVNRIGADPILYDDIEDVPEAHRDAIKNLIEWHKNR